MAEVDPIEEVVALGDGRDVVIARPREPEALLDEGRFEAEDEYLPYWAELWPSALALAREIAPRALRGKRVLELGCGLGLPSVVAALAGGTVCASDWSPEAVAAVRQNAERNGVAVEGLVLDWRQPQAIIDRAPWDIVLAADVLYETRNVAPMLALVARLGGELWLADPGRESAKPFLAAAREAWDVRERVHGRVSVFRMRLT